MTPPLAATPLAGAEQDPLLLVVTSLGGSHEDWRAAAARLGERRRVVAVDLPGHGASDPATDAFTIGELADAMLAVADRLGARRFAAAGISLGGAVVLELALRAPDRLDWAGIVSSLPRFGDPGSWAERAAAVRRHGTGSLTASLAERWFTPGFATREPDAEGRVLAGVAATDDESYARCCEALGGWDATDRLATLAVPVLAVRAGDDPTATADAMRPLLDAPGVREVVLPGIRHQSIVEAPDAVAEALLTMG